MPRSFLARLWFAIPEWAFRLLGASFFGGYLLLRIVNDYLPGGLNTGPYFSRADGSTLRVWIVPVLVDLTFLTIAWGYCVRRPARRRAASPREILLPFLGAIWPAFPFMLRSLLQLLFPTALPRTPLLKLGDAFIAWVDGGIITWWPFLVGCIAVAVGSALDIWAYFSLRRSLAIVAEARELVTTGPYRWLRHPVYTGQVISQAGVWLLLRQPSLSYVLYFAVFVAIQCSRAAIENRVLEQAFGDDYRNWRSGKHSPVSPPPQ